MNSLGRQNGGLMPFGMALMAGDNKWRDEERRINKRDTCALRSRLRKKGNRFPLVPRDSHRKELTCCLNPEEIMIRKEEEENNEEE